MAMAAALTSSRLSMGWGMGSATLGRNRLCVKGSATFGRNILSVKAVSVGQQQTRSNQTYSLPHLDYDYSALEPYINAEIMELHHAKHHQTYITNFNKALEQFHAAKDPQEIVALQSAINFNGGGHVNHSIFWKNLAPPKEGGGEGPTGKLASAIDEQFGSLDRLVTKMNKEGAAVQGSGWVWLGLNKEFKYLTVATTMNQDPLVSKGLVPLLGIDVWEHAYYLQYKNVRPDYLKNVWNVVNWKDVAARYESNV